MNTILHVIDTTGPGGAETVFIDLASRLPADKYRSVVLIRGEGWVNDELRRRGIEPILLPAKGSFNWRFLYRLCRLIRCERVDLVQSHLLGSNVYCSLAGLLTRTPVIATFHGSVDISEHERLKWLKFLIINIAAGAVVAVTDSLRDDIINRTRLNPDKIKVIYNGIDSAKFRRRHNNALREKYNWSDDDLIIGSLGNIRPAKGYDILLRVAALLEKSQRSYRFVVAGQGKGQLYDELLELRKQLGLEGRVKFAGFIDDAATFLSGLDLFLSTSISEGLPLSAIQAMVAELPVIATRCGGYVGLINDNETGLLVEVGDAQEIGNTIEVVMGDSDLRKRLARNANIYAIENFDIGVMVREYRSLYSLLMGIE